LQCGQSTAITLFGSLGFMGELLNLRIEPLSPGDGRVSDLQILSGYYFLNLKII